MDIVDKLFDLQRQAVEDESHYYVAAIITEAIQEMKLLRKIQSTLKTENKGLFRDCVNLQATCDELGETRDNLRSWL